MSDTRPESETTMTAVDDRDALAFVIIRPGSTDGAVSVEAAARGLSQQAAAYVLRSVADQWDPAPELSDEAREALVRGIGETAAREMQSELIEP